MKKLVLGIIAAAVLVPMARTAMAQSKTVSSEVKTATGTIEAVEAQTRTITIKKSDGTYATIVAGPDITRFAEVKVGQTVNVRVKRPGEPDTDTKAAATTGSEQALPGGTKAKQRTITATITAIDPAVPSVTFTGPNGWKYSSKVQDTEALSKVKVGDKVDFVWTEAMMVSLEPGK